MLDLKYEECKAEIKGLEGRISASQEMIRLINSAVQDPYDHNRIVVTYFDRPTREESWARKEKSERNLNTSKANLEKRQNWLKTYGSKRQGLIETMSPEELLRTAKESHLIYQALNTRLKYGQEKTQILKDTYFELLKRAAEHSQKAKNELKDIETNGFSWLLYVLPSEAFRLEDLKGFKELNEFTKASFIQQLHSNKPILIPFNEQ